ncbi:MAG: hypothetical protein WCV87_03770 [Candidatus Paceibacterota bacterium]|jgi:hypothetical protein
MRVITLEANKATMIMDANPRRTKIVMQMQATEVDNNNVGKIFVGFGVQPVATVGNQSQGEVLLQASAIEQPSPGGTLNGKYKKSIWVVSDTVSQTLVFEEEIEETI